MELNAVIAACRRRYDVSNIHLNSLLARWRADVLHIRSSGLDASSFKIYYTLIIIATTFPPKLDMRSMFWLRVQDGTRSTVNDSFEISSMSHNLCPVTSGFTAKITLSDFGLQRLFPTHCRAISVL